MDVTQAYLEGAGLSTQQFGLLAGMAQRAAEMEAQRSRDAFAQSNALADNERADRSLSFNMGNAAADNARQDAYLGMAQNRAALEQEQRKNRAQVYANYARQSLASTRAMRAPTSTAMGPMPAGTAQPGMGDPVDDQWSKMIDLAEAKGDDEALAWLASKGDSREARAKSQQWLRGVEQVVGEDSNVLNNPYERAVFRLYRDSENVDGMANWILARAKTQSDQQRMAAAGEALGVDPALAGAIGPSGMSDIATAREKARLVPNKPDPLADNRHTIAAKVFGDQADAFERSKDSNERRRAPAFRAAQAAVASGNVLPDGSAILNGGNVGRDGFVRILSPDGKESGITPKAFQAIAAGGAEKHQAQQAQAKQIGKQALLQAFQKATGRSPQPGNQQDLMTLRQIEAKMRSGQ